MGGVTDERAGDRDQGRREQPRTCASCGASFAARRNDARFCSSTCCGRARRERLRDPNPPPRVCDPCGVDISGRRRNARSCSSVCGSRAWRARLRAQAPPPQPFVSLDGEVWRSIPGYPLYQASSEGRIRSHARVGGGRKPTPTLLRPCTRRTGYRHVVLSDGRGGKPKTMLVHRAVLLAFLGSPTIATWTASHMNGVPGDNRIDNLSWEPLAVNVRRQKAHSRRASAERRVP